MTKHSRMVLADCEESLLELMDAKQHTMHRWQRGATLGA